MKGKILLVAVGLGVGYVLGSRAGRERYDEIARNAQKLWNDPRVQKQVNIAGEFVKEKAPGVAEFVANNVTKPASAAAPKSATPKNATVRKPAARKPAAPRSTTPKS